MNIDFGAAVGNAWDRITGWIEGFIHSLPNVVAALLILLVFWAIARGVRRLVHHAIDRVSGHRDLSRLLGNIAFIAVVAIGLFIGLGILGLSETVTTLLAGAGIIGLALGFAFQDIAENFIAGIVMMLRRPFRDGDIIESGDFLGVVDRINMRATRIQTFQGQWVIIPNSQVFKNPLTNHSASRRRRVDIAVGVSYGDDLERARDVAIRAVEALDIRDRSRDVELFYEEFGGSSINFQLRFWIDFDHWPDFLGARSEAIIAIKKAFDAENVTIPFPIRTLDFSKVGGVELKEAWPAQGRGAEGAARDA